MPSVAFKEWAVVCRALGTGRQSIILRKGGISERNGLFEPEYDRFWLYPTYFHEMQQKGIKPEAMALLADAENQRPASGMLHLEYVAAVKRIWYVNQWELLGKLAPFHIWTDDIIRQRFHYRTPGLYVLAVDILQVANAYSEPDHPSYAGCKTWVELESPPDEEPIVSVVSAIEQQRRIGQLAAILD